MKKVLLTLIILLSGFSLAAQDNKGYSYVRKKPDFIPEHDVRIGMGAYPLTFGLIGWGLSKYTSLEPEYRTLSDRYNYNLIGRGPKYTFGALSAVYTYRPLRWFEFGLTVSYAGEYNTRRYNDSKVVVSKDWIHDISVIPTFRFLYYSTDMVRLYSKIGIGLGFNIEYSDGRYLDTIVAPAWELTLFGISVGRRIFGYAEVLSFGATGMVSAGIGYRFK